MMCKLVENVKQDAGPFYAEAPRAFAIEAQAFVQRFKSWTSMTTGCCSKPNCYGFPKCLLGWTNPRTGDERVIQP